MSTAAEVFALAVRHHQAGNLGQAEECYRQIVQANPGNPIALNGLGSVLAQQGKLADAVTCFQEALQANPNDLQLHHNLGLVFARQGNHVAAIAQFEQVLLQRPDLTDALFSLGNSQRPAGRLDDACASFRQVLSRQPNHVWAQNNLGTVLLESGRPTEAETCFRHALKLKPDFFEAQTNLGIALSRQHRLEEAAECYRQALRLRPQVAEGWYNLGNTVKLQGNLDEAVRCFHEALRLKPDYAEAWNNLGSVLTMQDKLADGIGCYQEALRLRPSYDAAYYNWANALVRQDKLDEAIHCYQEAIKLNPNSPVAFLQRSFTKPLWDGSDLAGRTLLLHGEHGYGDTFQFIRLVGLVKQRGGRVVFECHPPLERLLSGVKEIDVLVPRGATLPEYDVQLPLLSLPGIIQVRSANMPASVPYLFADPRLVDHWKKRTGSVTDGLRVSIAYASGSLPLLVGIAWQGNPTYRFDRQRSIPLGEFTRLAKVPGLQLVSLQKGPGTEHLPKECGVRSAECGAEESTSPALSAPVLDEESGPFMDTAALIMNLDLVITSDTAVAHLAGALGVPVWVALPAVPDWRWLLQHEDSPWYPSMRLFRQAKPDQWNNVFDRMATELERAVQNS
jgi:tetratricopeptide (TPR) repeat protein